LCLCERSKCGITIFSEILKSICKLESVVAIWVMKKIVVSAPGKVIIHGEHAVVYGKVRNEKFVVLFSVKPAVRRRFRLKKKLAGCAFCVNSVEVVKIGKKLLVEHLIENFSLID